MRPYVMQFRTPDTVWITNSVRRYATLENAMKRIRFNNPKYIRIMDLRTGEVFYPKGYSGE